MTKNVKIDDEVHRLMSIRAARLALHKNVLATALIELALTMTDEEILRVALCVTSHSKTEYPNQDQGPKPPLADV